MGGHSKTSTMGIRSKSNEVTQTARQASPIQCCDRPEQRERVNRTTVFVSEKTIHVKSKEKQQPQQQQQQATSNNMSSNSNNDTLPAVPDAAPSSSSTQNRVSLDGDEVADDTNAGRHHRKRKQEEEQEEEEVPVIADTVASLSLPNAVIAPPAANNAVYDSTAVVPAPVPLTDEQQITSIVTLLLSPDNALEDVADAMQTLAELVCATTTQNFEENRKAAFRCAALLAVVQTMRRNINTPFIQTCGICVLSNIFCCKLGNFKPNVIAVGGLQACLEAMKRHDNGDVFGVQASGCGFIGHLWFVVHIRKKVVDEGGLKAVITAMGANKENKVVQRWGCFALNTLLRVESSWAGTLVNAKGIDLVIAAMNAHPNHADLQAKGCDFFILLSKAQYGAGPDYRKLILDGKGLIPVVEAQRIHRDNPTVMAAVRAAYAAISA
jgi:hypothetical protein